MKIAYCLMASDPARDTSVTQNVRSALPYVDAVVFVNGGTHTFEVEAWPQVHPVHRLWTDSFPAQRNAYLRKVDDLQAQWADDVLICVADDDELYSSTLWADIRRLGEVALEEDVNQIAIQCHSVTLNLQGERIFHHVDDYWKGLIILWEPGIEYVALGPDRMTPSTSSFVHEFLLIPSGTRYSQIRDPDIYYEHVKTVGDVYFRATRNAFAGGGGPNLGDSNPLWRPFQELVRKHALWVQTSKEFEEYLKAGNIHPEVKEAMLSFRHLGTPRDPRTNLWPAWPDGTSEWREMSKAYFALLHPEELPLEIVTTDYPNIGWIKEIRDIHGSLPEHLREVEATFA